MNVGFISTRLAGNDGVSLETMKWVHICERLGHNVFYCAGELEQGGPEGMLIPEIHFATEENMWIREHAYKNTTPPEGFFEKIESIRSHITPRIKQFISDYKIDILIPQNIFAVPLQIPLALAVTDIIKETGIPTISHNHDYYWERDCYEPNCVQDILDSVFPPKLPSIYHVCINSIAQKALKERRKIDSVVIPNVFDFATPAPTFDEYNADFRSAIGLADDDIFILAPVRVIRRKGLELAIEVLGKIGNPKYKFILSHGDDVNKEYLSELEQKAKEHNVDMRFIHEHIGSYRQTRDGKKVYILWDAYLYCDFVMYPSIYEGFGNALLETVYFKKPMLVNNYIVYKDDIAPLGFDFVEIDGQNFGDAMEKVVRSIDDKEYCAKVVEKNYTIAQNNFSYKNLEEMMRTAIEKVK